MENSTKTDVSKSTSYASVLSRGKLLRNDVSNNNPPISNDVTNGNERLPTAAHLDNRDSATHEDNQTEVSPLRISTDEQNKSHLNSSSKCTSNEVNNVESEESTISSTSDSSNQKGSTMIDMNESNSSAEFSDSGESQGADESNNLEEHYPNALKWKFRAENPPENLPETVTVLETSFGSKVYLVGTAHFSVESQEDVAKTIKAVQPDSVLVELCNSRLNILSLDEATVLEEAKNMSFQKIKATIEQNGVLQGILYFLLLSMSYQLTKQLGMAPGGEFRRAYTEAMKVPGCVLRLGDRPINITLHRALAKLSWWQKLRIAWQMLRSNGPITKEEVERCKQKDLLEEMLAQMAGEFPELSEVFLVERDIFLTYSLQMAALPVPPLHPSGGMPTPSCVVGVVGIGHVRGIQENWEKVKDEDVLSILSVPEPSLSSKIIRQSIRLAFLGLGVYGVYKLVPRSLIPSRPKILFPSLFRLKMF